MSRSDFLARGPTSKYTMNNINIHSIAEIEKELRDSHYDMISMVFLLYDDYGTALENLIIFQRVYKDVSDTNLQLLQKWYKQAKSRTHWKQEFLEALITCQLYSIVKKLGFDIPTVKEKYQPENNYSSLHINAVKKALYKFCEYTNINSLEMLKKSLLTYGIDTMDYEVCELVLLDLLSRKFITVNTVYFTNNALHCECDLEKLIKIIECVPGYTEILVALKNFEQTYGMKTLDISPTTSATQIDKTGDLKEDVKATELHCQDFSDTFELFDDLILEEGYNILKCDSKMEDRYPIKDSNKLGVCLVINQDNFYPSQASIECDRHTFLDPRLGSDYDKFEFERTITLLKFHVISRSNLNHNEMVVFIRDSIENFVTPNDSVFMLCIMSHGVRDHVYAADSVKVRVENIKNLLDSGKAKKLHGIPKVLILQACQVNEPQMSLMADNSRSYCYHLKQLDFLVYWATSPAFKVYKNEKKGSLFIQILCSTIRKHVTDKDLHNIMTIVNNEITKIVKIVKRNQVPSITSTLTKKLYLQIS